MRVVDLFRLAACWVKWVSWMWSWDYFRGNWYRFVHDYYYLAIHNLLIGGLLLRLFMSLARGFAHNSLSKRKCDSFSIASLPVLFLRHSQFLSSRGVFLYLPSSICRSCSLILNLVMIYRREKPLHKSRFSRKWGLTGVIVRELWRDWLAIFPAIFKIVIEDT